MSNHRKEGPRVEETANGACSTEWMSKWRGLVNQFPAAHLLGQSEGIEQPGALVAALIEDVLSCSSTIDRAGFEPMTCPNCGKAFDSIKSPYCSESCREVAAFVRQIRSAATEERILDEERQLGMGQALWSLLGGGYPHRIGLIPGRVVKGVIDREKGICEQCGGKAVTVDHARTACNRPINLRAVCESCSRTRAFSRVTDLHPSRALYDEIVARLRADAPARPCDDAATWDWRDRLRERKARKIA